MAVNSSQPMRRIIARLFQVLLALALLPLFLTALYTVVSPPATALMVIRGFEGYWPQRQWKPLEEISPHLLAAVISSEDSRFCAHRGVDWEEMNKILEAARRDPSRVTRGASTIHMQTAKNLYFWPWRSYVRKALEIPHAYWIGLLWPKERIIEVYLNVVEWGPGVYGAEAAARHHFSKSAATLTRREAALLAATLPAPLQRSAGNPGRTTQRIASVIERRMRGMGPLLACVSRRM